MSADGEPIRHCPVCRYDLTGLPKDHRCPECGFEYEESMRMWRMAVVPPWLCIALGFVLVLLLGVWLRPTLRGPLNFRTSEATLIVLGLGCVVPFILAFYPRGSIVLGRSGMCYRFPFRPARVLKWSQLRVTPTQKLMLHVGPDGVEGIVVLPTFGMNWRKRRRFHTRIEQRWREAMEAACRLD